MPCFFRAFPFGSGYPLYLFCLYRTKKDAAAIPNAASEKSSSSYNRNFSLFIKSLRKLKYTWLSHASINTNFSVFYYVFFNHTPSFCQSLFKHFIRWFSSINQHYHAKKNCSIWVEYRHHHL